MLRPFHLIWPLVLAALVDPSQATQSPRDRPLQPSYESARSNANHIFNAIHSAGRQWGSAVNHNGFSFFPVTIPRGTVTYHGSSTPAVPKKLNWLAFVVEHAEFFARSVDPREWSPSPPKSPEPEVHIHFALEGQVPLLSLGKAAIGSEGGDGSDGKDGYIRGYLHTYQANRDLQLLYIDGLSAGNSFMGTLDAEDLILRGNDTLNIPFVIDEPLRARELCDLAASWGLDGLMRTEIGFEILYCDFRDDGLTQLSTTRSFPAQDRVGMWRSAMLQWARAAGERYDGVGEDRARIDFSSMVSAFFFPVKISESLSSRPGLLRLRGADMEDLADIKTYLNATMAQPRRFAINWQQIVDTVVSRYTERLAWMRSPDLTNGSFIDELETATLTYYDAPAYPNDRDPPEFDGWLAEEDDRTADAIKLCARNELLRAQISKADWSKEDELIYTALETVTRKICTDLFSARAVLLKASGPYASYRINNDLAKQSPEMDEALVSSRAIVTSLTEYLSWTTWYRSRRCPVEEIEFIAMWPFGDPQSHYTPGCRSVKDMQQIAHDPQNNYWRMDDLILE